MKVVVPILLLLIKSSVALAIHGEISLSGSYSKTKYGGNAYSVTKQITGSAAVLITSTTNIELSYTKSESYANFDPVQTVLTKDDALGVSIVQVIVPPTWRIQPYLKVGGAQYNRVQSGTIYGVEFSPISKKSPSALVGAGIRIYLSQNFSLKIEAISYAPNLDFSEVKNNHTVNGGFGWRF